MRHAVYRADGCKFQPIVGCGGNCNYSSDCTSTDKCAKLSCSAAGKCQSEQKSCNDNNNCTVDSCDAATGQCKHGPIKGCKNCKSNGDCDDGKPCTIDRCYGAGTLVDQCYWTPLTACFENEKCTSNAQCNDNNQCTQDSCYTYYGVNRCRHVTINGCDPSKPPCKSAADCSDGKACTYDFCNTFSGACSNPNIPNCTEGKDCKAASECNDNKACTEDKCVNGKCETPQKPCVDGNPCTYDGYCRQSDGKCIHNGIPNCTPVKCTGSDATPCADNDKCTLDLCIVGFCNNYPIPGCQ